jgi:hypothetical protein
MPAPEACSTAPPTQARSAESDAALERHNNQAVLIPQPERMVRSASIRRACPSCRHDRRQVTKAEGKGKSARTPYVRNDGFRSHTHTFGQTDLHSRCHTDGGTEAEAWAEGSTTPSLFISYLTTVVQKHYKKRSR